MFAHDVSLLHFGPFTVDLAAHCLLRDGVRVVVQEQPYQILLALLDAPGQVVTRESLRLRLWGEETFVDFDQSLNSAVRRLRVALEDSPRQPVYVGTVPRVGFRFLAEVREERIAAEPVGRGEADENSVLAEMPPSLLPAPESATRLPMRSFVVLFGVLGLLSGVLAGTGGARMWTWLHSGRGAAITEAKAAVGRAQSTEEASLPQAAVGGRWVPMTSSPETAEAKFAIMPASDRGGSHWAESSALVPAMTTAARPGTSDGMGAGQLTELTGWYHLGLRTEVDYGLAKHAFEQAIAADPRAPTALVGLGETDILMALNGYAPSERLHAARLAGERAVRLAPDLADAHAVLGAVLALEKWNLPAAEREFRVALALDPHGSLAQLWLSVFVLLPERRYGEAEQHTRQAIHDAPLSLTAHTNLGWIYFNEGRRAEAIEQYRFVLGIHPNFVPARFHYSQLLRAEGRTDEFARMQPSDPPAPEDLAVGSRGTEHGETGHGETGTAPVTATNSPAVRCQQITGDYTGGGADAMTSIRAAVEHRCSNFFFFGQDPAFAPLHGNPEFAALQQTAFVRAR